MMCTFQSLDEAMQAILKEYTTILASVSVSSNSKVVAHKHHEHGTFIVVIIPGTKQAYCYKWLIHTVDNCESHGPYYVVEHIKEVLL